MRDDGGRAYLDLLGGIAVNALGHAHPAVVGAVSSQAATLGHTSNLFINEPALHLCERLAHLADTQGGARVFLCNSGAEANEAAFKLARLTGRTRMVAASAGFHGRTMGALALTGQPAKADPFRPLPGEVTFVPYGDADGTRCCRRPDRRRRDPRAHPGGGRRRRPAARLPAPRRARSPTRPALC